MYNYCMNINKYFSFFLAGLIFLFHADLSTQQVNEAFLQSLSPEDRQRIIDNQSNNQQDDNDEKFNANPDTRLYNLEDSIKRLKNDLYSLERAISLDSDKEIALSRFGDEFFNSYQSSFSPINAPRIISDYILDVGDSFNLQIVGSQNKTHILEVNYDGAISIPGIGNLRLAGLRFDDALKAIENFVSERSLGSSVYLTLEKIRDMNILIIGHANNPGMYTLPGGSSILSLLSAAGGIDNNGSFRSIEHRRNNNLITKYDLYDVLINGNMTLKNSLRSGDVLVIQPAEKMVSISGGVNKPAIYELKGDEGINDLVRFSRGYIDKYTSKILINRYDGSTETVQNNSTTNLNNGDNIFVPKFFPASKKIHEVRISGAVNKPGTFSINSGDTLSDVIKLANGYSDNAYPMGGKLLRKDVAKLQQDLFDKSYNDIISHIASSGSEQGNGLLQASNLEYLLNELRNIKPEGRVAAEFDLYKIEKDPYLDTVLSDGDEIIVPYFSSDITIYGAVNNPTSVNFGHDLSVDDYISIAGGYNDFALKSQTIIILPNGRAFRNDSAIFFKEKSELYPGSIIYVPREIGKIQGIAYAATFAPIISSLALSIASLNSLD
jgi:polysaccharide export outer membrane protein